MPGVAGGSNIEILQVLLLLHMYLHFLVVLLADAVRLEAHLDVDGPVGWDGPVGGDVAEGRAGVGVVDAHPYLLQHEVYLKVADVLYLYRLLAVFLQQNAAHRDQPVLRLNSHLRTHSFALQHAAHRVLLRVELQPLLEALLLNGLELDHCLEGAALHHFLQAV